MYGAQATWWWSQHQAFFEAGHPAPSNPALALQSKAADVVVVVAAEVDPLAAHPTPECRQHHAFFRAVQSSCQVAWPWKQLYSAHPRRCLWASHGEAPSKRWPPKVSWEAGRQPGKAPLAFHHTSAMKKRAETTPKQQTKETLGRRRAGAATTSNAESLRPSTG